eukprot:SAG31_NODE_764_length_12262_cov_26.578887_6_plen_40_part_00
MILIQRWHRDLVNVQWGENDTNFHHVGPDQLPHLPIKPQ